MMERASRTAIVLAQFRAAHVLDDSEPIFEDTLALELAGLSGADVREFFATSIPPSCAHVARLFPCQRSRFVEEEVARRVRQGVDQFVDLGAGLSSFAWRRPDLMSGLELFEVDHPATQEWKRERIDAVGLESPDNLHFASVDLAGNDDLGERLTAAGFDPGRASIWSWLGVILYLPIAAVQSTLTAVAELAAPNSTVIASYGVPDDLMEPASREFAEVGRAWTAQAGEPQITWPAPAEIEAIAKAAGWSSAHSVDPASLAPWFANRPDGLEPVRYEWLLVAEV
jgi:methyltransferase (TIGR00027 family)